MKETLHILQGEIAVGSLVYDRKKDEISLIYEQGWQFGSESFPISISLPLARKSHPDAAIRPFLQGLLPDNPAVIEAWGKRFHVSPRNPFDVVKHVGEDCAGALQFVRPERLEKILSGELDSLIPLSDADLEKRMTDIAGTDAHSKKHSLIHGPGSFVRSAPLYDLASFLPYQRDANSTKVKLAMKIGGTYRLHEIDATRWKKWALEGNHLMPEGVIGIVRLTVQKILESVGSLEAEIFQEHDSPFVGKLADAIKIRAIRCADLME